MCSSVRLTLFLLLLCAARLHAQDSLAVAGTWSLGLNYHTGFLIAHRPALVHLQNDHSQALEVTAYRSVNGDRDWQGWYNYPLIGFGFRSIATGNESELGQAYGAFAQLLFPLSRKNRLTFNVRFGLGIGYVEKPFDTRENYKNMAIGSAWNGAVNAGIQARLFSSRRLQLTGGLDAVHFSNGSAYQPNLGINIVSVNAGLAWFMGEPQRYPIHTASKTNHRAEWNASLAFAVKDLLPSDGPRYGVVIASGQYLRETGNKSLWGGGADIFIDGSLPHRPETDTASGSYLSESMRIGVYGAYGLRLGRWDGLFQTGFYPYTRVKEDGRIYSRLAFRYFVRQNVYVCINLKSHFARADYFEWGIGYRIRK